MKTKLLIVASALLLAAPAFAQEPLEKSGTEPSTTQNAPGGSMAAPEPLDKSGTEPSTMQAAPPQTSMTPEPLDKAGSEQSQNMAPAAGPNAGDVIVIGELRESEDDNKMVDPLKTTVDKVEEMDVFDATGKKIAEVDSVLEDKNGQVKGVAIEYGGFLGFGEKGAVLTLDQVKEKYGSLVTEVTEDQLPTLPTWKH